MVYVAISCPKCAASQKKVHKCLKCLKYTCSECSFNNLCVDCYTEVNSEKIVKDYEKDKMVVAN